VHRHSRNLDAECARTILDRAFKKFVVRRRRRIEHHRDFRHARSYLLEQFEPLSADPGLEVAEAGDVTARMGEVRDHALANRIGHDGKDNRHGRRQTLHCHNDRRADRNNHIRLRGSDFCSRQCRMLRIGAAPAVIQMDVYVLGPTRRPHSPLERGNHRRGLRIIHIAHDQHGDLWHPAVCLGQSDHGTHRQRSAAKQ
jgi:hypothetical protein